MKYLGKVNSEQYKLISGILNKISNRELYEVLCIGEDYQIHSDSSIVKQIILSYTENSIAGYEFIRNIEAGGVEFQNCLRCNNIRIEKAYDIFNNEIKDCVAIYKKAN